MIVDLHLDLAWNVARGRDVTRPAAEQPIVDNETATVGLPDLAAGGVGVVGATLFANPADPTPAGDQAYAQLRTYEDWERRGLLRIVREVSDFEHKGLRAVVLMEGADPIDEGRDAAWWHARGVRIVGLAWRATRYAAGTGAPGGLTDDGRRLSRDLDHIGVMHDLSHLAEAAADEMLDLAHNLVIASHSNCRSVVGDDPGGRHLPDRQIAAIARRGGVVGINLFDHFLLSPAELRRRRATVGDWVRHVRHACDVIGDARHVGLGSDLDGGFGREMTPLGIDTAADLPRLGDALADAGLNDAAVAGVLGGNWMRVLRLR